MRQHGAPQPRTGPAAQPFWEGWRQHRLIVPRCRGCRRLYFPPREMCPWCMTADNEWVEVSGRGRLYSFVVAHDPYSVSGAVPSLMAVVELEEGLRMLAPVVGVEPGLGQGLVGMPVEAVFDEADDDTPAPRFRPVGGVHSRT